MKYNKFVLFLIIFFGAMSSFSLDQWTIAASDQSDVSIRLASMHDLKAIIELDNSIGYEYFKPLFLQYPELGNEEAIEKLLASEIEYDASWFTSCIGMEKQQRLYVASDGANIVGFVVCHQEDDAIVVIDLLMIDACCRGKGIGKRLIKTCIQAFPQASTCMLVVLDKNEQAQIAYKRMGFVLMDKKPSFVQEKYPESRFICYSLCC